jgi:hypothetical protein
MMATDTTGFTYLPDERDVFGMSDGQVWACDACGTWLILHPEQDEQSEFPDHQLEHEVIVETPNPFAEMDVDELQAFLQATPLHSVHPDVRRYLLDRCIELGIPLEPYEGWLEGARLA